MCENSDSYCQESFSLVIVSAKKIKDCDKNKYRDCDIVIRVIEKSLQIIRKR